MDLKKTGEFIASKRKAKNMTQVQLAQKLMVSEKTVSKWECGKGFPDTSLILALCNILEVDANELLSGKSFESVEEYKKQAEQNLLQLKREQTQSAKLLLFCETALCLIISILSVGIIVFATFLSAPSWLKVVLYLSVVLMIIFMCLVGVRIEQKAGYYECQKCNFRYVPTYSSVFWAMHFCRTRYMKCPCCKNKSWQKKVVDGEIKK